MGVLLRFTKSDTVVGGVRSDSTPTASGALAQRHGATRAGLAERA